MSFLDNYNPRIIKERWNTVRQSPYAALKFQYMVTRALVVFLILFISYMLIMVIINYDGGSSTMTMVIRLVMFVVMVIVVIKVWGTLTPLKNALKQYEQNPSSKKSTAKSIDVAAEVDEIFKNIEKNKNDEINKKRGVGHQY